MFSLQMKKLCRLVRQGSTAAPARSEADSRVVGSVDPEMPSSQDTLQAPHGEGFLELSADALHPRERERFLLGLQPADAGVAREIRQREVA